MRFRSNSPCVSRTSLRLRHRSMREMLLARVDTAAGRTLSQPSMGRSRCQGRLLPEARAEEIDSFRLEGVRQAAQHFFRIGSWDRG